MRACAHTTIDLLQKHILLLLCIFFLHRRYIYISFWNSFFSLRTNKVTIESNSVITILSSFNVGLCGFLSTVP